MAPDLSKIYIAYRRNGGSELASLIASDLSIRKKKKWSVFFDIKTLESGMFDLALFQNLEQSKHFVLILTRGALDRCIEDEDWVRKEIATALKNEMNIIPVIHPDFKWPRNEDLPEDIRNISRFNGIPWSHYFQQEVIDKIEKFIEKVNTSNKSDSHEIIRQIMLREHLRMHNHFGPPMSPRILH